MIDRTTKLWRQAFLAAMTGLIAGSDVKLVTGGSAESRTKHERILRGAVSYADDAVELLEQQSDPVWRLSDDR